MSDLIKGLAWVSLLAIALLLFLVYSVYKLNQRADLMNQYNDTEQESQGIETTWSIDSYESNIIIVSEPNIKKNFLSI